jgi:hypothetical protein
MVAKAPKAAAEIYVAVTKEKITVDELVAIIRQPGAISRRRRSGACSGRNTCTASA